MYFIPKIFYSLAFCFSWILLISFILGNCFLVPLFGICLEERCSIMPIFMLCFIYYALTIDILFLLGLHPDKYLILDLTYPYTRFKCNENKIIKHNNYNKSNKIIEKRWQEYRKEETKEIKQETKIQNTFNNLYEKEISNIIGNYSNSELESIKEVSFQNIVADKNMMKKIYENTNVDYKEIMKDYEIEERKRTKNHRVFEGRLATSDKNYLKSILGYRCMCCGLDLSELYGVLGNKYIELHHLIPYADLDENETRILNADDFAVLCPNCHRMIHRLDNPADINLLKKIIKS